MWFPFKQAQHYSLWQITLNNSLKQDAYRFSTPKPSDIKSQFEVEFEHTQMAQDVNEETPCITRMKRTLNTLEG